MTGQIDLFGNTAKLARTGDPKSSHDAARVITKSGTRDKQKAEVLEYLNEIPGSTSMEIATHFGVDRYMVARRLPDLRKDGLVLNGEQRECKVSCSRACTWFPS